MKLGYKMYSYDSGWKTYYLVVQLQDGTISMIHSSLMFSKKELTDKLAQNGVDISSLKQLEKSNIWI